YAEWKTSGWQIRRLFPETSSVGLFTMELFVPEREIKGLVSSLNDKSIGRMCTKY
ncbi:unnamed protein product, partial [marine sediment metagenome]